MAARRICSTPGCPERVEAGVRGGRCQTCRRATDRDRGSREDRGYGAAHQAEREDWQRRMDAGEIVQCWRGDGPVDPTDWHLGHDDQNRSITRGPEHPLCNLRTAGMKSH